jgi:hypothetical protein
MKQSPNFDALLLFLILIKIVDCNKPSLELITPFPLNISRYHLPLLLPEIIRRTCTLNYLRRRSILNFLLLLGRLSLPTSITFP